MTTEGFYPMLFEFEKNFDQGSARHWVQANWVPLCSSAGFDLILTNLSRFDLILIGLISPYLAFDLTLCRFVYLLLIYLGRRWMASRPPFNLRSSLAAWSFALALFSILGFLRNSSPLSFPVFEIVVFNRLLQDCA